MPGSGVRNGGAVGLRSGGFEMDDRGDGFWPVMAFAGLALVLFLVGASWWNWYRAVVQQEVWRRQGCEMTRWEVFMGSKPIERNMRVSP